MWVWELGEWMYLSVYVCSCGWSMGVILHVGSCYGWVGVGTCCVCVCMCEWVSGCG